MDKRPGTTTSREARCFTALDVRTPARATASSRILIVPNILDSLDTLGALDSIGTMRSPDAPSADAGPSPSPISKSVSIGTRFILQIGHVPGLSDRTSGCILQVYSVCEASCSCPASSCSSPVPSYSYLALSAPTSIGTKFILQMGHVPGLFDRTSGCILHVYSGSTVVKFMPQIGHVPGSSVRTSGCILQV